LDGRGFTPAVNAGTAPRRHQRSRRKGVRTPDGVIYVGRPTVYGNPFNFKRFGHARSVALYRCWIERRIGALSLGRLGFGPHEIDALFRWRHRLDAELPRLVGADLQCWCPVTSRWCHADVLIAHVANLPERIAA
jgi:hypothetical protein